MSGRCGHGNAAMEVAPELEARAQHYRNRSSEIALQVLAARGFQQLWPRAIQSFVPCATASSRILVFAINRVLGRLHPQSLVAELAIFGVADVIAAIVVPLWLESGTVGKYSASWLVADVLISLFLNSGPDAALHLFLRIKSLVMLVRALADQEVPKLQIPPELEAALEDAHDLKCPITLELLVDPCILNGKIYERVAIAKWIFLHHTVPHSPARRAFVRDLKPCPKMKRLIKQL
ncbi:hypothetical protein WJX74_001745 [Apatococcus lobatus]|uniref:U-box domain-containing protein n=1 Tax=Apatococcus lobatus TaxID=904363 RepID=A0AAW1QH82_9CHLO